MKTPGSPVLLFVFNGSGGIARSKLTLVSSMGMGARHPRAWGTGDPVP